MTIRISLGIDKETGAEKFQVTDDQGNIIGYDLAFPEE
jgi:hypothetical protein